MREKRSSVFIVEDHAVVRAGLLRLLDGEPDLRVVGEAADAESALHAILEVRPDLVVVDLGLPGSHGLDLVKRLTSEAIDAVILVLSMYDDAIFAERALRAGARGYVNKRESTETLISAVRGVLLGEVWLSQQASTLVLKSVISRRASKSPSTVLVSDRELEVMHLLGAGKSTREIAYQLKVSVKTVESHRSHLKEKLELRTATELVAYAARYVAELARGGASERAVQAGRGRPGDARPSTPSSTEDEPRSEERR